MPTLAVSPSPSKPERFDVVGTGFDPTVFVALVFNGGGTTIKIPVKRDGSFAVGQYVASTLADGTYRLEARKAGSKTVLAQADVVIKKAVVPPIDPPPSGLMLPPLTALKLLPLNADPRPGYLQTIRDSTFPAIEHRRITNTSGQVSGYSRRQAWNKGGTVLYLPTGDKAHRFRDGKTYADLNIAYPGGTDYPIWSNVDPDRMWGCSNEQNVLRRFSLASRTWTVHHTFAGKAHVSIGEYEGNISDDDSRIALEFRDSAGVWGVLVYDPIADKVIAERTWPGAMPNNCAVSRSGLYVVVVQGADGSGAGQGTWVYDTATMAPRFQVASGRSHGDPGRDAAGNDIYVHLNGDTVNSTRLDTGQKILLLDLPNGLHPGHVSCTNYERSGEALLNCSIKADYNQGGADLPGLHQLVSVLTDGTRQVRVFGFHHGTRPPGDKDADVEAAFDRLGERVLYRSRWDGDPATQLFSFVSRAS